MKKIGAIILAAGKGKRMKLKNENKVTLMLDNKPMVKHIVDFMHKIRIDTIVIVVGFAKNSVINLFKDEDIIFAEQKKRLGTGHALYCAIKNLPDFITDVLVVYGDDAVLYDQKNIGVISRLFDIHYLKRSAITFLTIEQENPFALGRIVRDNNGNVLSIVEEKDATDEQLKIREINPGCFVFSISFLRKYLPKIKKSSATGEYYLTSLIDIAIKEKEIVETLQGGKLNWRGVNNREELQQAEMLYKSVQA